MTRDYTSLITSEHRGQPKFAATVGLLTGALVDAQRVVESLTSVFDINTAVGVQLDIVGLWVGLTRRQTTPIGDVFLTWNDPDLGWNHASWKGPYEPSEGVTSLDDNTYRALLKAKVAANYWVGTREDLNLISEESLVDIGAHYVVVDNFDMSVTVYVVGAPSAVLLAMIKKGVVIPKTAGVRITGYTVTPANVKYFALDIGIGPFTAGLDIGVMA